MIAIEWGRSCDAFGCVVTDISASLPCFVFFCFVALCHYSYVKRVSSECLCKSFVFVSLVFLRFFFGCRVISFCSAFCGCFDRWSVCFCFCCRSWLFALVAVSSRCCYGAVSERRTPSFSSQVMCFDLERAVPAFVLNVGGCFDTWNALLFHQ